MIRSVVSAIASADALAWITGFPLGTNCRALQMEASELVTETCATQSV